MEAIKHGEDDVIVGEQDMGSVLAPEQCLTKTRSLSDGGGAQLSPSPFIIDTRRTSKDDSSLRDVASSTAAQSTTPAPVTPRRPDFPLRGLSLHLPSRDTATTPGQGQPSSYVKPSPLSPKLDQSHIYASPTNILPRRSRGLDFSRAATSLHHSTLAEQSSPDTSPTIGGGRAMNIPGRSIGEYGIEQSSNSLWSIMGNQERMNVSSSIGSANHHHMALGSDTSSSSDDDDPMDEEMEDAFMGTPHAAKTGQVSGIPWMPGNSPAANSLNSFRARPRKQPKKKFRGLLGLGFNPAAPPGLSKSPPNNVVSEMKDSPGSHARRESISWAANQLHISAADDEKAMDAIDIPRDGRGGVVRRAVTRRGNLLPKTKGFARIRAALAEEGAPVDSEFRREAEVIRQVRESDMDLEPRVQSGPPPLDIASAKSSPNLNDETIDDMLDDDLIADSGLSSSFKQQALKNSKGKQFWDDFSETSSVAGSRVTPPPPAFLPRGSSSGISDMNMDSPLTRHNSLFGPGPALAMIGNESDSQRSETPQASGSATGSQGPKLPPTAEEITRRINNKRRRDDDFDPVGFKRRAVSPGMSVHNSPVMQSPLQRDMAPWGSRPGSNGGDKASGTPSDNGSTGGTTGGGATNNGRPISGAKGRVGFQGMVDTHDGLMRMSIE
ncbi:hypothetical protein PFICI_10335 [Pestalotiopsis fici W106-1]|uniref:Uncharacterized protein n=1 Tax=Pestalotiopsis fici (strain W106-1 / CGMCC3.15140) TaxID=1229662 RepID=W3WWM4_PESFW|nr:uncharacterized protein PFICI_10335 [Pestalotiopsis fici W106-1]ETS78273.1 hypothetical protein PFICI_10335 [Pestalotiopsis fici W106-1]